MHIVDVGSGAPIVLVPGIQGRWEWMKPAVDALARRARVLTFSLADEPTSGGTFDEAAGFDSYVNQIAEAMDAAGLRRAAVCGVSYGGLIAAAFAARHPERVSALVLASAIPPAWKPNARVRFYLRAPRLLTPLFMIGSLRMWGEIAAATPGTMRALAAGARYAFTALAHMFSPTRMARRVRLLEDASLEPELRRVNVPALLITGDAGRDRVVPVELTREYMRLWPHAGQVTLAHTGHIGLVTRPDEFARLVTTFVEHASQERRDTGAADPAEPVRRRIV